MTILRRLALRSAVFLERHASPGWKEWAGGIRRETDFIDSDWQALKWTASGLWTLLDYRPQPIRSLEELAIVSQKFADKQRFKVNDVWPARNMVWLIWAVQIVDLGLSLLTSRPHSWSLCSVSLKLLGMSILLVYGFMTSGEPDVPDRDDIRGLILFYLTSTERMCKRAVPVWLVGTSLISLGYGLSSMKWDRLISMSIWFVLPLLLLWMWPIHYRRLKEVEKFNLLALGDL